MVSAHRQRGCDLADDVADAYFNEVLKVSSCSAKTLWKLDKANFWQRLRKWQRDMAALLGLSAGLVPHASSMHKQFRTWLGSHSLEWCLGDTERCIFHLLHMCRRLRRTKTSGRQPPKKFQELASVMDLIATTKKQVRQAEQAEPPERVDDDDDHRSSHDDDDDDVPSLVEAQIYLSLHI